MRTIALIIELILTLHTMDTVLLVLLSYLLKRYLGELLSEKPGQNSGQANYGIFWLSTTGCILCERYTKLHLREKVITVK